MYFKKKKSPHLAFSLFINVNRCFVQLESIMRISRQGGRIESLNAASFVCVQQIEALYIKKEVFPTFQ